MERATPAATEERLQGGKAEPVSEYASSPLDSPSTPMEGFIHRTSTIDRDSVRHRSQGKYVYDPLSFHQPIIIVPAKVSKRERESGTVIRWIGAKYLTGFWMGAFYDLAFVAVLSIFSTNNEIDLPSRALNFFAFFSLLWWNWAAQIMYDIRFETDDLMHRLFKLVQLCGLAFLGAASAGWNLFHYKPIDDVFDESAGDAYLAGVAFTTVTAAFFALRFFHFFQTIYLWVVAKVANRRRSEIVNSMLVSFVAWALSLVSLSLNLSSKNLIAAQIACLFAGVAVEIIGIVVSPKTGIYMPDESPRLPERLGNLTLIILGEGIIGIFKSFNRAIGGFSRNNISVYVQVFCAILIVYLIFDFAFAGFEPEKAMSRKRMTTSIMLHFPLHWCLLFLLAAMSNVINSSAFISGAQYLQDGFLGPITVASNNQYNYSALYQDTTLILQLATLNLNPPYGNELAKLSNATSLNTDVEITQYAGQILIATTSTYQIDLTKKVVNLSNALQGLSSVSSGSTATNEEVAAHALELYLEIFADLISDLYRGTVWLYPAAGGALVLIAIVHILSYAHRGRSMRFVNLSQIIVGFALALLGLLDIGDRALTFNADGDLTSGVNPPPLYSLLVKNWALPVVALVFGLLWLGERIGIILIARKRGVPWLVQREEPSIASTEMEKVA